MMKKMKFDVITADSESEDEFVHSGQISFQPVPRMTNNNSRNNESPSHSSAHDLTPNWFKGLSHMSAAKSNVKKYSFQPVPRMTNNNSRNNKSPSHANSHDLTPNWFKDLSAAESNGNKTKSLEAQSAVKRKKGSSFTLVTRNVYPSCSCRGRNKDCKFKSCICVRFSQECGAECGCSEACSNMGLTKGVGKKVRIGESRIQGLGCFAEEDIRRNDYIGEYTGKLVLRADQVKKKNPSKFLFEIGHEDFLLDGEHFGSEFAKMNHQTKKNGANSVFELKRSDREWRVGVWALKDINKGQELFGDYGESYRGHGLFTPVKRKARKDL